MYRSLKVTLQSRLYVACLFFLFPLLFSDVLFSLNIPFTLSVFLSLFFFRKKQIRIAAVLFLGMSREGTEMFLLFDAVWPSEKKNMMQIR